jgi:mRNA interferase MazF
MAFIKNFTSWFNLKPVLDSQNHTPPFFKEGEIWWCRIGENVGSEISGKGDQFTRPVVIKTKLSRYSFLAIPTTTKLNYLDGTPKSGSMFVRFIHKNVEMIACLNQIKVVDYRRLKNKLGDLDQRDFNDICNGFTILFAKK